MTSHGRTPQMRLDEHTWQAIHNERFSETIDEREFPDWLVTVLFYASVHWIEAAIHSAETLKMVKRDRTSVAIDSPCTEAICEAFDYHSQHKVRRDLLSSNRSYFNCFSAHSELMELSHIARYTKFKGISIEDVERGRKALADVKKGIAPRIRS